MSTSVCLEGVSPGSLNTKGHIWSGWPGAYCLKCQAEHAMENAIALGWVRLDPEREPSEVWMSPFHKDLVLACDGTCYADLAPEEAEEFLERLSTISREVTLF